MEYAIVKTWRKRAVVFVEATGPILMSSVSALVAEEPTIEKEHAT